MKKYIKITLIFLIFIIVTGLFFVFYNLKQKTTDNTSFNRINPDDLEYLGAFRLPTDTQENDDQSQSWTWGGSAITYYPKGDKNSEDDFPGSLFLTNHELYQYIGEISIPTPVISKNKDLSELNVASNLQKFTDIKTPEFKNYEQPRFGLCYLPRQKGQDQDKLYFSSVQHLDDESITRTSHGWINLDLSNPDIHGPWAINNVPDYFVGDYLFQIPKSWADKYINGYYLATGRFRDGGQASQGPTIYALAPWKALNNGKLDAITLLEYSSITDDPNGEHAIIDYSNADAFNGATWVETSDKHAIIFSGIKATGKTWYGYSDGTIWPEEPPYPPEPEGERGWWSEDPRAVLLFYDPDDLAEVTTKEKQPYEIQPYAKLDVTNILYNKPNSDTVWMMLGPITHDPKNNLLYMVEFLGDYEYDQPLIHVWKIA